MKRKLELWGPEKKPGPKKPSIPNIKMRVSRLKTARKWRDDHFGKLKREMRLVEKYENMVRYHEKKLLTLGVGLPEPEIKKKKRAKRKKKGVR